MRKFIVLILCYIMFASLADARVFRPNKVVPKRQPQGGQPSKLYQQPEQNYQPEYRGQKDDYDPNQFRNDPTVLESGKRVFDPTILISSSINDIKKLDNMIKTFTYDPTTKTIKDSKSINVVYGTKNGNCFEVARYAWSELFYHGYEAYILQLEFLNTSVKHAITVFKEKDQTWSMFQISSDKQKGYYPLHKKSIEDVLTIFKNVKSYKVIKK